MENPELRPATLDFTPSEQGYHQVTQLFADGVQIINALELVDWDGEDTQFLICEDCGFEHCKPGDWVRVRRSESLVLILPSFDYVWAKREEDRTEYRPPSYMRTNGIPYFDRPAYEGLGSRHSSFPLFEKILPLNMREAALLFHWDAPARVLGHPPDVRVNEKIIVGSSEGSASSYINELQNLLSRTYKDESKVLLRQLSESNRTISIYIDASEFTEWKALVADDEAYRLVVDSNFVIERHEPEKGPHQVASTR